TRMYRDDDDAHSLGETRAAQVESSVAHRRASRAAMDPQFERTTQMPPYSPSGAGGRPGTGTGAPASTSRFCGTCGARIVGNEAFCGQCGAPVGLGSGDYGGDYGSDMDRRGSGPGQYGPREDAWATADREAATESFAVAPMPGYARS